MSSRYVIKISFFNHIRYEGKSFVIKNKLKHPKGVKILNNLKMIFKLSEVIFSWQFKIIKKQVKLKISNLLKNVKFITFLGKYSTSFTSHIQDHVLGSWFERRCQHTVRQSLTIKGSRLWL